MTRRSRTDLDRIIEQYVTLCECVLHGGIREYLGPSGVREPAALAWRADVAAILDDPQAHGQLVLAWCEKRWEREGLTSRIRQTARALERLSRQTPQWSLACQELATLRDRRRQVGEAIDALRQRSTFTQALVFVTDQLAVRGITPLWR